LLAQSATKSVIFAFQQLALSLPALGRTADAARSSAKQCRFQIFFHGIGKISNRMEKPKKVRIL
jgi:hypothetical protein